MTHPILWSFRRCPYAMRARLAVAASGSKVELREIILRDKPQAFLATSPSATVPCLDDDGTVIDESYDIMLWALQRNDPEGWLIQPEHANELVKEADGPFKQALDRYKYASRHADVSISAEQEKAALFLHELDEMLANRTWLFGTYPRLADMAILPFIRQFAHVDLDWFIAQPWPNVARWLQAFKASDRFTGIMTKYSRWHPGDDPLYFP